MNTKDQAGRTPLHYAALENDLVRLGDLLAQGADPNAADELTLEPGRVDVGVVRSALAQTAPLAQFCCAPNCAGI